MSGFIGLTSKFIDEVKEITEILMDLNISSMNDDAKMFLGENSREFRMLQIYKDVSDNPEKNLWLNRPA